MRAALVELVEGGEEMETYTPVDGGDHDSDHVVAADHHGDDGQSTLS